MKPGEKRELQQLVEFGSWLSEKAFYIKPRTRSNQVRERYITVMRFICGLGLVVIMVEQTLKRFNVVRRQASENTKEKTMQLGRFKRNAALCLASVSVLGLAFASATPANAADPVTTITWLTQAGPTSQTKAKAIVNAFEYKNPTINVEIKGSPSGADRDNLIKTKLATGNMEDVFDYNSGALLQALNPAKTIVPVTNEKFQANVDNGFKASVRVGKEVYGAPFDVAAGGGVYYNLKVFKKAGVKSTPKTWVELIAAAKKIKATGVDAVCMTNGDNWTSQLAVLADFYNVNAAMPNFVEQYEANKAKFAKIPAALAGFQHLEELTKLKLVNKDSATAKYSDAETRLPAGKCGMYMMGTWFTSSIPKASINNVGFFALPGKSAKNVGLTMWAPSGLYISANTKNLAAAKTFQAFVASKGATNALVATVGYEGPFATKDQAPAPADAPLATRNLAALVKAGKTYPALEFLSGVKGPNLGAIAAQVSTLQVSAAKGAALYDQDVVAQAKQLGLPGW